MLTKCCQVVVATTTETCSLNPVLAGHPDYEASGGFNIMNLTLCPGVSYDLSVNVVAVTQGNGACYWLIFGCTDDGTWYSNACNSIVSTTNSDGYVGSVQGITRLAFALNAAGYADGCTGSYVRDISLTASSGTDGTIYN